MSRACFRSYTLEEEADSEEEAGWDEAARLPFLDREKQSAGSDHPRALCNACSRPLRRIAKVPDYSAFLMCASAKDCQRCGDQILAGELHFMCASEDCKGLAICKECGPGVYIMRTYDYANSITGDKEVLDVPAKVIHKRKARQRKEAKRLATRSICFDDGQVAAEALQVASTVAKAAEGLATELVESSEDLYDSQWEGEDILCHLLGVPCGEGPLCAQPEACRDAANKVLQLVQGVSQIFASQPTLNNTAAPCKVFGDIHGQLRDLLLLFGTFGMPGSAEAPRAVFNGDFVDRGKHQLEVVVVLFALKVAYPTQVYLNRGNHEDKHMNAKYGFEAECINSFGPEYGPAVYDAISSAFMLLPLGCVIASRILVVHGGIGDGKWSLNELRKVARPLTHEALQAPANRWLWNILWSDPIEDDQTGSSVFGVHNSPRSKTAVKFGWNVTQAFCARNGLDLIVRSHQSKKGGLGFDVMHNESLIRVFSARDYERNANDGAVLDIRDEGEVDGENEGVLTVRSQVLGSLSRYMDPT
mmetsp:Transcript_47221/g.122036  ORF Transcript_47221/g.122036 Transcript_47221/m.122036 type:complete len:531 (+) Transcript_47221:169-1761(+)